MPVCCVFPIFSIADYFDNLDMTSHRKCLKLTLLKYLSGLFILTILCVYIDQRGKK